VVVRPNHGQAESVDGGMDVTFNQSPNFRRQLLQPTRYFRERSPLSAGLRRDSHEDGSNCHLDDSYP
jgi:hypothetical protein